VQAPDGVTPTLESLHNKVVTLLFWSPTCENCQAEFPHLLKLMSDMPADRFAFVGVVNAPAKEVKDFLQDNPMPGWVGIDKDWSMVRSYAAPGTPFAVVINRRGLVAAFTHPSQLSPEALERVWDGGVPNIEIGTPLGWQPRSWRDAPPLYEMSISPASPTHAAVVRNGALFAARSAPLRDLFAKAYGVPASRVVSNTFLLDAAYDVTIAPKPGLTNEQAVKTNIQALRQLLESVFPVRKRPMTQEMDVYLLSAVSTSPMGIHPSQAAGASLKDNGDGFVVRGFTMLQIAERLTKALDRPVVDDTGLEGRFDAAFTFKKGDIASVLASAQRLGLVVAPAHVPVQVFSVERGDMAPTPLPDP